MIPFDETRYRISRVMYFTVSGFLNLVFSSSPLVRGFFCANGAEQAQKLLYLLSNDTERRQRLFRNARA
jgi:hypothetical protein